MDKTDKIVLVLWLIALPFIIKDWSQGFTIHWFVGIGLIMLSNVFLWIGLLKK